ncbi:MAG: alginate export family protein [Deferribacteres bacterium]|nr:alginate export family protein [candidate division KSB1 bacterium]MCB9500395.1 alginate export family protein [Deferribacteres bacterium]
MSHKSPLVIFVLLVVFLFSSALTAQTKLSYKGVYTAWAQSQHAFTFNDETYDDNYVVQMFRLALTFQGNENVKAFTRFDMAQGWWGVDNEMRTLGYLPNRGASALFDFKDTNYLFHVDQAYVNFKLPGKPISATVGRMNWSLGNKIMLDNNYDGIQIGIKEKLTFGWAKVSEGADALDDRYTEDEFGFDNRDANLLTVNFSNKVSNFSYNAYGFFYKDASIKDGTAFVPDLLQFFKTRFSAQPTKLMAFGLSGTYKAGKLSVDGEFDFLTGEDEIANTTYANAAKPDAHDINNGDLSGFNLYLKPSYAVTPRFTLGGVLGMGSGDDDVTGGKGNVNKLRTSGFFYITEIWEDSIMPDEEGITPQGLGAPNVRGYRELENTTALQVNASFKPVSKLELFGSFTFLKATQDINAWTNTNGVVSIDKNTAANDLGTEIDFRISYVIDQGLSTHLRGGWFTPGDAACYLINGNTNNCDKAWELKGMITYNF